MKILLVAYDSHLTVAGGFERVLTTVVNNLQEKGYEVRILAFTPYEREHKYRENWVEPYSRSEDLVEVHTYFKIRPVVVGYAIARSLGLHLLYGGNTLAAAIIDFRPDVIIVARTPLLIDRIKQIVSGIKLNSKILYWNHGDILLSPPRRQKLAEVVNSAMWQYLHKRAWLRKIDGMLSISSGISESVRRLGYRKKIYLVYNPVERYDGPLVRRASVPQLLFVGRLFDGQKNISLLLRGLSLLQELDWKLRIVGTGPDALMLKKYAQELGIDRNIEWVGAREDPYANLDSVTATVLTSRWEGLPTVLIESIQRGIPVLSSDCNTGPSDIIIPGINGQLFREGDISDFVAKLRGVIEGTMIFRTPEEISATASKFEESQVMERMIGALQEMVSV